MPRLVLGFLVVLPAAMAADTSAPATFSKDVAPIFQRACQNCHRDGSIAPMSLMTYKDARPWARSIKEKVVRREMPPWHIDRNVGVNKFKDDPSLTDAEIATITNWVDHGIAGRQSRRPAGAAPVQRFRQMAHRQAGSDRLDAPALHAQGSWAGRILRHRRRSALHGGHVRRRRSRPSPTPVSRWCITPTPA